jgi:glucose-6-phosphate isomerase
MPSSRRSVEIESLWQRFRRYRYGAPELGFTLDVSRVRFGDDDLGRMSARAARALDAMAALEAGALANYDEGRMVGHYWLRAPELAPTPVIGKAIANAVESVRAFAARIRTGELAGARGRFEHVVHVGIGGSALGPELLCDACGDARDPIDVHFLDNADPDGVDRLLARLDGALGRTLVSVVSKSGFTPTTLHLMLEVEAAFRRCGLNFERQAVATTIEGSDLDALARARGWLARFPIWEWVGGRTSITSAVGLLPGALKGVDVTALLREAAAMDCLTRVRDPRANPAVLLALMWYLLGNGRGDRRMVIMPYKDRLALFPRYVQQLVMESVGKERDRGGAVVHQGLTVYGNKGSTDQHAYVQQLRDGTPDFFVTFVHVGDERRGPPLEVMPGATLGDHLFGYLEATRDALHERGRDSVTIEIPDVSPASLGTLIALYERAVGIYAELINVNAYDQPGVVKSAAAPTVELQQAAVGYVRRAAEPVTAEEVAVAIGRPDCVETVYKLLDRLSRQPARGIAASRAEVPFGERFQVLDLPVEVSA